MNTSGQVSRQARWAAAGRGAGRASSAHVPAAPSTDRLSDAVRETARVDGFDEQRSKSEDHEQQRQPERRHRGELEAGVGWRQRRSNGGEQGEWQPHSWMTAITMKFLGRRSYLICETDIDQIVF